MITIRHSSGSINQIPTSNIKVFWKIINKNCNNKAAKAKWIIAFRASSDMDSFIRDNEVELKSKGLFFAIHCDEDKELAELILNRVFCIISNGGTIFDFYSGPLSLNARDYDSTQDQSGMQMFLKSALKEIED